MRLSFFDIISQIKFVESEASHKPGFVSFLSEGDDHLSWAAVTNDLMRPYPGTRTGRSIVPLFGLAPGGVCRANLSPGCR